MLLLRVPQQTVLAAEPCPAHAAHECLSLRVNRVMSLYVPSALEGLVAVSPGTAKQLAGVGAFVSLQVLRHLAAARDVQFADVAHLVDLKHKIIT